MTHLFYPAFTMILALAAYVVYATCDGGRHY